MQDIGERRPQPVLLLAVQKPQSLEPRLVLRNDLPRIINLRPQLLVELGQRRILDSLAEVESRDNCLCGFFATLLDVHDFGNLVAPISNQLVLTCGGQPSTAAQLTTQGGVGDGDVDIPVDPLCQSVPHIARERLQPHAALRIHATQCLVRVLHALPQHIRDIRPTPLLHQLTPRGQQALHPLRHIGVVAQEVQPLGVDLLSLNDSHIHTPRTHERPGKVGWENMRQGRHIYLI